MDRQFQWLAALLVTLLGIAWPLLASAETVMTFKCRRFVFTGFDLPDSLLPEYSIRVTAEPADASYWFESGIWEVADLPVARSELELNFEDLGPLVEPGRSGTLRQFNGNANLDDEWRFTAQGSGVINVEDHVVADFGLAFTSDDPDMVLDHLGNPAEAALERANWGEINQVECYARLNWLPRPDLPLAVLRSRLQSITLQAGPGAGEDPDGDGRLTASDNCPAHYNPGQDNSDGDRVGDACDTTFSRTVKVVTIAAGDRSALSSALVEANTRPHGSITEIRLEGDVALSPPPVITPPPGFDEPVDTLWIERDIRLVGWPQGGPRPRLYNAGNVDGLRFASVLPQARLALQHLELSDFDASVDGGVIRVLDGGHLSIIDSVLRNNRSTGDGGAVHFAGHGQLKVRSSRFEGNQAARGGALFLAPAEVTPGDIDIRHSRFFDNSAGQGCDLHASSVSASLDGLVINSDCGAGSLLASGELRTIASTVHAATGDALNAGAPWRLITTALHAGGCAGNGLVSEGWNFAADSGCSLDQPSDFVGVDARLDGPDADGLRAPRTGSPLIDAGPAGLVTLPGDARPVLPCGWKDAAGLGRPQDGDGDGVYECDIGAVEVAGAGAIGAGHSGAFYNRQRSGEGQYVEILDDQRAVVYTFSYRPGGGPAWFLTLADIVGNSLVSATTVRPTGTTFGAGFDADEVWRAEWGGLSMVFADCEADDSRPGNTVYAGSTDGGWEPLVTRSRRLTHVAGCGDITPAVNAGLSGSFYDPARSGEGLVVEWLPNGDVLAIMFTYDLAGEQFWMFGTGTPDGQTVTFEAFYPAGEAAWGGQFDPDAVGLETWGTFTLDYQDCDTLQFSYAGPSLAWGSATRSYRRLTRLAGLACPDA